MRMSAATASAIVNQLDNTQTRSRRAASRVADPSTYTDESPIFQELRASVAAGELDEQRLLDLIAGFNQLHAEQEYAWFDRVRLPDEYRAEVQARLSRLTASWVKFAEIVAAPAVARGNVLQRCLTRLTFWRT
jgi:hypothetical protein